MKQFFIIIFVLLFAMPLHAIETTEQGTTITLTLSQDEWDALETDMIDIKFWITNALESKLRHVMDRALVKDTIYNPSKMSKETKMIEFKKLKLPKAITRNEIE